MRKPEEIEEKLERLYRSLNTPILLAQKLGRRISFVAGYGCEYLDPSFEWLRIDLEDNWIIYVRKEEGVDEREIRKAMEDE